MSSLVIEKQIELDKSRKKFFDDSKFDAKNQKYGMFSFPGTLAVSSRPYYQSTQPRKNSDGTVKTGPHDFLASHVKKGKIPDSYFSFPEYMPDKYSGQKLPFKSDKERADVMRKKHEDQAWKPSGNVAESMSIFPHMATDVFKTIKRKLPDGTVRLEPKNFYTSPPKKGNNTPGVLLGGYPEHKPDSYDRQKDKKKYKGVTHDGPFKKMDHGNKTFNADITIYGGDPNITLKPKRSISANHVKHDLPFKATNVSNGSIGAYPEYIPNPLPVVKKKSPSEQVSWKVTTRNRSAPSTSITSNTKNLRSEYPMLRRMG
ncbi:hypothetical protein SteCoe_11589 [Stentor coeruleus]|uniref:Cilia-and flagella-associated protein 96 n=1 Tax=Stentor coeruleus TaxID=5963 RepID=A0A1R2CCV3_9CILI|nr:hypothetical protein SteCoe_11589 [Stentor coeruleus]